MTALGRVSVFFDGACEPVNPGGTASYGYVIETSEGEEALEGHGVIGTGPGMTNNVAEYEALAQALQRLLAWDRQFAWVGIHGDSNLVIRQMRGEWRVNRGAGGLYLPYHDRAAELAAQVRKEVCPTLAFLWIPRDRNSRADDLSKLAFIQHQQYVAPPAAG